MEREAICNATVEMSLVTSTVHLLSIGNAKTLCKLRFYMFAWREMCMVYHDHQLSKRNTGQNRAISLVKACYFDVGSESTCNWFIVSMHLCYKEVISLSKLQI